VHRSPFDAPADLLTVSHDRHQFSSGGHGTAAVEDEPHLGFRVVGVPILRLHPPIDRHPVAEARDRRGIVSLEDRRVGAGTRGKLGGRRGEIRGGHVERLFRVGCVFRHRLVFLRRRRRGKRQDHGSH
jgi:hypothetical protein